jgi:hypothetical protein
LLADAGVRLEKPHPKINRGSPHPAALSGASFCRLAQGMGKKSGSVTFTY